jgi:anion-transporting  ArsA/GET3 family ATPase
MALLLPDTAVAQRLMLLLQERIRGVKALFRDKSQTEFIIATIPTQLGINESRRLLGTLREEGIPCKRIIVNQVWLIHPAAVGGVLFALLLGFMWGRASHASASPSTMWVVTVLQLL